MWLEWAVGECGAQVAGNTSNAEIQSRAQLRELKIIKKTRKAIQLAFTDSGEHETVGSEIARQ